MNALKKHMRLQHDNFNAVEPLELLKVFESEKAMATTTKKNPYLTNDYPTSDGRPMAETDHHRKLMTRTIETLEARYALEPLVYVSGNLLVFYIEGDRRHLSPDVFVVRGVEKRERINYLIWEEGKPPEIVIELTSSSTRHEDVEHKFQLYQDTLKVSEYFLFDPFGDYLKPPFRGYRLKAGKYVPMKQVKGRFPSKVFGLHLERDGKDLRFFDPVTQQFLLSPLGRLNHLENESRRAAGEPSRNEALILERLNQLETDNQQLRRQIEELRRRPNGAS